jgi:uncharacterized protein YdhG (YjbR/CyaY superfamily)
MKARSGTAAATIDAYLKEVPADQRAALEKLRKTIRAAVPAAEECISYGMPAFRLHGKALVAFAGAANHCSFFPMSGTTVETFGRELEEFETSKGTIRFQPDKPIPAALVRKIVRSRIADIEGKRG